MGREKWDAATPRSNVTRMGVRSKRRLLKYKRTRTGIAVIPPDKINAVGVVVRSEEGDMKFDINRRRCAIITSKASTPSKFRMTRRRLTKRLRDI